jgi:hypothetical protein
MCRGSGLGFRVQQTSAVVFCVLCAAWSLLDTYAGDLLGSQRNVGQANDTDRHTNREASESTATRDRLDKDGPRHMDCLKKGHLDGWRRRSTGQHVRQVVEEINDAHARNGRCSLVTQRPRVS